MKRVVLAGSISVMIVTLWSAPARAGFLDKLMDQVQQTTEDRARRKVDEAIDRSIDKAQDKVTNPSPEGPKETGEEPRQAEEPVARPKANRPASVKEPAGEAPAATKPAVTESPIGQSEAASKEEPSPLVDAGKDFTPGTRVIAELTFERDMIGNFPRGLKLKSGNAEVAMVGKTRMLRATSFGEFVIPLPDVLPIRFTMEFDFMGPGGWDQSIRFDDRSDGYAVEFDPWRGGIRGPNNAEFLSETTAPPKNGTFPVQIMADGSYVKVYMNGVRVANAPTAMIGRSREIRVQMKADRGQPAYFGHVRIAAGGRSLYQSLMETGRYTAEGILFDTNSDKIRSESAAVLKEIGDVLKAHADLNLVIEGHTDNVGAEAANKTLSERRAASVKDYLVKELKVPAARLTTQGLGSTVPVASNDTAEGRQSNRRVELVAP
jgi:outer membrane protein OmpA-like peptidoglycan-associated protein